MGAIYLVMPPILLGSFFYDLVQNSCQAYTHSMAVEALDLELRQKAKAMIAHGSTSADVARVLGLHPGTVREWKRRYEWRSPSDAGDRVACSIPMRIPTDKQAVILIKGEERAKSEGFFPN